MALDKQRMENFLGAFPEEFMNLGENERRISAQIYRLLALGDPVPIAALAASLDLPLSEVEEMVGQWTGLYYDDDNSIIAYWGLALREMGHKFEVDGVNLYTWCAWDALFIPQILGKTARVESIDPVTKETIHITVSPDGVESVSPSSAVTSFMLPDRDEIRSDVIKSFCHYVHFFASQESVQQWIAKSPKSAEIEILSIEEGYRIGAVKNGMQYGNSLGLAHVTL